MADDTTEALPEVQLLADERQARAFLHPVRMRMLQFLAREPLTSSKVAATLGVHPANLTHHFRKLLDAGLIRLVEERDVGRVIEKYYRAVARRFELREEEVTIEGAGQRALAMLERDLRAAARALGPDARDLVCFLANARLPPDSFERFRRELERLVRAFQTRTAGSDEGEWYSLSLALYPRAPDTFERPVRSTRPRRAASRASPAVGAERREVSVLTSIAPPA